MCWSASVSLNTFLLGLFAVSLGLLNNITTPLYAVFLMSFISIQLVEYFAWKNLSNPLTIRLVSIVGLSLIILQPFASLINITTNPKWRVILLSAYTLFILMTFLWIKPLMSIEFKMSRADNGHLRWHWLEGFPIYVIVLWCAFFLVRNIFEKEYIAIVVQVIVISVIYMTYVSSGTWGSLWCWIANVVSFYIIYKVFSKDICGYIKNRNA